MKTTLKLSTLALCLSLCFAATAEAKQHRDCPQKQDLVSSLKLNAEQSGKMEKLMAKHREAMDKLRDQHEQRHNEDKAEMKKLWDSQRTDVAAVLTPSQLATFDKMQKDRHHHRHNHHPMDDQPGGNDKPRSE
jgi:Spy/CpxP family protein refolding chaperone